MVIKSCANTPTFPLMLFVEISMEYIGHTPVARPANIPIINRATTNAVELNYVVKLYADVYR